jgi:predicted nuclease with TOPRIM domain/arsenate reductase-like glutaredoxin family protein
MDDGTMSAVAAVAILNPYPGLRPYEPEEDFLFFGREKQIDELVRRLRQTRFLAVVGGSGSGKSSLVRAGLIPVLHGGGMARAGSRWRTVIFRPGDQPIVNLAEALYDDAQMGRTQASREVDLALLETTLRSSSAGLSDAVEQARLAANENLVLVVDQFEELFRYRSSRDGNTSETALAFVKLLLTAAFDPAVPVYVVLTMRSDFIGNCAEFPGLAQAISDGQYLVPRMSRAELRSAITGPAAVAGGEIAPRVVVRLLNEVGDDPDQLPVLQHALMRSWEFWRQHHAGDEPLDNQHYEAIGTMQSALSKHAEEAWAELQSDDERAVAEKAFRALVETDEHGRVIRRPSTVAQIAAVAGQPESAVRQAIDPFRAAGRGFIVLRTDSFLDLSHESLTRIWERLARWAQEEAEAAALYRRLSNSAKLHQAGAESLWTNPQLALGLQWLSATHPTPAWAERYDPELGRALDFLEASRKASVQRRVWRVASIAAFVLLIVAIFAVYGVMKELDNRRLVAANTQLVQSNKFLQGQVGAQSQQHAELEAEVNALLATQASLKAKVKELGDEAASDAPKLTDLQKQSDDLQTQLHNAELFWKTASDSAASAVAAIGADAKGLPSQAAQIQTVVTALSKANAQNRDLMTQIIQLGIPLPEFKLSAEEAIYPPPLARVLAVQQPAPYHAPPNAYLVQLLAENARLLNQAQQLTSANQALQLQAEALRKQNDELMAITADLREQVARLEGEIRTLTQANQVRAAQLSDLKNSTAGLNAIAGSLNGDVMLVDQTEGNLASMCVTMNMDLSTVRQLNQQLRQAIENAKKKAAPQ